MTDRRIQGKGRPNFGISSASPSKIAMAGTNVVVNPVLKADNICSFDNPSNFPTLKAIMVSRMAWKKTTRIIAEQATHMAGLFAMSR